MNEDYYRRIKKLNISHYAGETSYYTRAPLRKVEEKLLTSIPEQSKILDVGCGSGRFSIGAAQKGHNVTGVDITPEAVKAAEKKARSIGLSNVRFCVGDMTELEFKDSEFDYVFCPRFSINAVATFNKRKQAINEMMRVVKPNGCVYVESFNKFYLGRGPFMPIKNILTDLKRQVVIIFYRLVNKKYTGLLPGDIVYQSNKVVTASEGYAHLPTVFELKELIPSKTNYKFHSIPQILNDKKRFDLMKYFRYSIWIFIKKD